MGGTQFLLDVVGLTDELEVARFRGRESLSSPFRFDLDVIAPAALEVEALLARGARLRLYVGGFVRVVAGEIERAERGQRLAVEKQRVRLRLVPRLRRLRLRRRSRVFQDVSTREIVAQILSEHGVLMRSELLAEPVLREICIQHEETDLELVTRLLAEEGIAFRFDAPPLESTIDAAEVLVIFDQASRYGLLDGPALTFRPRGASTDAMLLEEHHVSAFVADQRVVPTAVELTAFDFQRPQQVLKARSEGGGQPLHVVTEAHGPYGETQVAPQPPSVVLDQVRRRAEQHLGESHCARLAPGYVFSLGEHDHPKLSGEHALAGVRHEGQTEDLASPTYSNRFTTVPKTFLLRPKRPARRVRQALETALVTGPPGEEIHTDPLGRIQVRFHWDDRDDKDAPTSCWIRVAQSWAGAGWGAQFIPRVGMEALVAFLGGDPDRPVVVGCLPNATHPPAFPLPDNKTRSGWKSRSTPDHPNAGSNEISFEDASGGERVSILAKRDLDIGVTRNMHTSVSGEYVLEVASSHDVVIAGSQRTTVRGVGACSYGAGGDLDVEGDLTERIAGDQRTAVRQDHVQDIGGSMRSTIKGDRKETVSGPWTQEAESLYTLVVGSHEADGHAEVQVRGSSAHVTEGNAIVEAKESLTLICGESRVELTPHSITIRAQRVGIEAKDIVVQGDGPALRLTDRAEIVADQLKLFGKESSLELERDATVKGSKVYLNCGPPPPPTEDDEGAPNLQKLKLRLSDELFHPYAEKRFELRAGGFKADGVTGADGTVEVDVPKTARVAQVEVWTEDYPTGPRKTYTIAIGPIDGPETLPGVRARLKNLGYFHGADAGAELDEATVAALRQFQADHGLPVTGQPDTETSAVIVERHGH